MNVRSRIGRDGGVVKCAHLIVLLFAVSPTAASAQCPILANTPKPAGAMTLVGMVSDTARFGVDSADVLIASLRRRTMTTASGAFRFNDVKPGTYAVTARRIGFVAQQGMVVVGADGGVATFCLLPTIHGLAPVVSTAKRGGLSGVVGDTAFNILRDVEISVVNGGRHVVDDSTGAFFIDLKPGRYVVQFKRPGFGSRLVSVTIPNDSGRKMLVWLAPVSAGEQNREAAAADELKWRLDKAVNSRSQLYTREDLNRTSATDLLQLANMATVGGVSDNCSVMIDGGPRIMKVWELKTADLEMFEAYESKVPPTGSRRVSLGSSPIKTIADPTEPPPCQLPTGAHALLYAWLRK